MKPKISEWLKHKIIGSPIQPLADQYLHFQKYLALIKNPSLSNIFMEDIKAKQIFSEFISQNTNCIDIGCHIGSVIEQFVKLSPFGKHMAIEPIPYKAAWLRKKYPQVIIKEVALGESNGELPFYFFPRKSGFSGLSKHLKNENDCEILTVKCVKLDEIVPTGLNIGFIKIDVEGAELSAFRGAKRILTENKPTILFECTQSGLNSFNYSSDEVFEFLHQLNYDVFWLHSWLHKQPPLTKSCFNMSMKYPFIAFNFLAVHRSQVK